jgi:glycerol-3-phosphate acyltransferase PlsX
MKLALDVMGGDRAPTVNILGAKAALELYPQIEMIYLVGDEKTITKHEFNQSQHPKQ